MVWLLLTGHIMLYFVAVLFDFIDDAKEQRLMQWILTSLIPVVIHVSHWWLLEGHLAKIAAMLQKNQHLNLSMLIAEAYLVRNTDFTGAYHLANSPAVPIYTAYCSRQQQQCDCAMVSSKRVSVSAHPGVLTFECVMEMSYFLSYRVNIFESHLVRCRLYCHVLGSKMVQFVALQSR